MNKLVIIVPCYNEEEVFKLTCESLTNVIKDLIQKGKVSNDSYILYVNDGSNDNTWNLIQDEYDINPYCCGLNLADNVGHQNALFAGLMFVKDNADVSISIDADLQDDILVIEEMIDKYNEGHDIVYGVRNERKSDSFFKRTSAQMFYKIMSKMGVKTIYNHADFRLMSKRATVHLAEYKERNLFLRGIVANFGFPSTCVYYARKGRVAGDSKYPLKKMMSFAVDGITSFSRKPITYVSILGLLIIFLCVIALFYSLFRYFSGETVSGWSSLFISIWFLGGVQLLSIGIIGEYVGKIYLETKKRPRYHIEKDLIHKVGKNEKENN